MSSVALILPTTNNIHADAINYVINNHRQQTIPIEIIISNHGHRDDIIDARKIERHYDGPLSLAKARNAGVWSSTAEWIIFSDVDTIYDKTLFEEMLKQNNDAVAGRSRRDVREDGTIGEYYRCGFAPLLIKRNLFEDVGGYNEAYANYGHEDSSLEHKLSLLDYDSRGDHLMWIHNMATTAWDRSGLNGDLFNSEQTLTLSDRIAADRLEFNKNYHGLDG